MLTCDKCLADCTPALVCVWALIVLVHSVITHLPDSQSYPIILPLTTTKMAGLFHSQQLFDLKGSNVFKRYLLFYVNKKSLIQFTQKRFPRLKLASLFNSLILCILTQWKCRVFPMTEH